MQAQDAERLNQEATDILTHSLLVSNKLPHFYCHEEGREGRHQAGKYPFTADQGMAQPKGPQSRQVSPHHRSAPEGPTTPVEVPRPRDLARRLQAGTGTGGKLPSQGGGLKKRH